MGGRGGGRKGVMQYGVHDAVPHSLFIFLSHRHSFLAHSLICFDEMHLEGVEGWEGWEGRVGCKRASCWVKK
jgi:hypothetical protein